MPECERLGTCAFFKEYEKDESKKLALKGMVQIYCKGDKMESCVRMKVSQILGGPANVPINMMPNGQPLSGTDMNGWSDGVRQAMK